MKQPMSSEPRKVLILAYDFPPYPSVGGLRPFGWFKFMKSFGIEPIVVTRQWRIIHGDERDYISASETNEVIIEHSENGTIVRAPFSPNFPNRLMLKYGANKFAFLRKFLSFSWEVSQFLTSRGPKSTVYRAASDYLKNHKVDAIIATGDPFILFKYASRLSKKHDTPWIADYRDLWVENKTELGIRAIRNKVTARFEKRFLKNVAGITTVSEFLKENLKQSFPDKSIHVHQNGYDPSVIDIGKEFKQVNDVLSLSFTGYIYDYYPVEAFFRSCEQFLSLSKKHSLRINFYGISASFDLPALIKEKFPSLLSIVTIHPKMVEAKLIEKMRTDNVLILFNSYAILGTKIFNYVAMKRYILLCFESDPSSIYLKQKYYPFDESLGTNNHLQQDMLSETKSGVTLKDSNHLVKELSRLHQEFNEKRGILSEPINIEQYSREIQTKKLAAFLQLLIHARSSSKN